MENKNVTKNPTKKQESELKHFLQDYIALCKKYDISPVASISDKLPPSRIEVDLRFRVYREDKLVDITNICIYLAKQIYEWFKYDNISRAIKNGITY